MHWLWLLLPAAVIAGYCWLEIASARVHSRKKRPLEPSTVFLTAPKFMPMTEASSGVLLELGMLH